MLASAEFHAFFLVIAKDSVKPEACDTGLPAIPYSQPQKIEGHSLLFVIASNMR